MNLAESSLSIDGEGVEAPNSEGCMKDVDGNILDQ